MYTTRANTTGNAMCEFTGNCAPGITPNRFHSRITENRLSRNGIHLSASAPRNGLAAWSRTNR